MSILKEPVLHFALLGVGMFAYFSMTQTEGEGATLERQVVIAQDDAGQLIEEYRTLWKRPPTPAELDGLITGKIREEVLVREAKALGLERNDSVIRNRLRQKMQFLMESAAQSAQPTETDLETFLRDHPDQFRQGGRVAFDQVFLGENPSPGEVQAALAALRDGQPPTQIGQATLLPAALPMTPMRQLDGMLGAGFSQGLAEVEIGVWSGPVPSGYGAHLVRVNEVEAARLPDLSEVRDKVEMEWRRQKTFELTEAQIELLLNAYEVDRPDTAELTEILSQ